MEELAFNPYLAFGWCVLAGFVMSMGGGGGGILAGIGHISILGIGDPNMIKAVNQILEIASRIVSVPFYHKQKRIVWPLAVCYAIGAPAGAILGSWLSRHYLTDMSVYKPVFGALVVIVAIRVMYEAWSRTHRNQQAENALAASEEARRQYNVARAQQKKGLETSETHTGPKTAFKTLYKIRILFGGHEFDFNPIHVTCGAFCISFVSSIVGVGGGFMTAPMLASLFLFPMYLVTGTALIAVVLPVAASVITYIALHVQMDWWLVGIEAAGIMAGSFLGPALNRYMNERLLKLYVAIVLLAIGIYYLF